MRSDSAGGSEAATVIPTRQRFWRKQICLRLVSVAVLALICTAGWAGWTVTAQAAAQPNRLVDGATPPQVVDVPSCTTFLTGIVDDQSEAASGCQALATAAASLNLPFNAVFGCGYKQLPAVEAGAQPDPLAIATCLGLVGGS